jgi:hypothetical protein
MSGRCSVIRLSREGLFAVGRGSKKGGFRWFVRLGATQKRSRAPRGNGADAHTRAHPATSLH